MAYRIKGLIILLATFCLTSCLVGPNYVRPKTVVPSKFKEAEHKNWKPINPKDAADRGKWWTVFNDSILNQLEEDLNKHNMNIANAEANFRQSLAIVDQARSSYFPLIQSTVNAIRQKTGGGTTTFFSTTNDGTTTGTANVAALGGKLPTTNTFSGSMTASWEPDLWGRVRRTVEANTATAQSDSALLAVTRLSAQGALAQYYFEMRALDSDQKFLDDTVTAYKKVLQLTRNQYTSGIVSRAEILQAQNQLETAQSQAENNKILRGQYEHAIAVLTGRPPAYLNLQRKPLRAKVPPIPVTVPSLWLERRPDIAQAERLVQTNSALVGVAIAAFYPNIALNSTGSGAGNSILNLFNTPSLGWILGMQVAQTIFDAGFRSATIRAARATYEAQVAAYKQVVLSAFQEVEDNLLAMNTLKQQLIYQNQAAASAEQALKLITNQYQAGTVAYSSVLIAQINAFNAQKAANDVAGLQMTSAVALIKSLGGGWDVNQICPPAAKKKNHCGPVPCPSPSS